MEIQQIDNIIEIELDESITNTAEERNRLLEDKENKQRKVIHQVKREKEKNSPIFKFKEIVNLISFSLSIVVGITAVVVYMLLKREDTLLLYCLEISETERIPFGTSSYSIFLSMTLMLFCLITSIVKGANFKNNIQFTKDIFPYLPLSLYPLMTPFIISMFTIKRTFTSIITNLILALLGIILITLMKYRVNKKKFSEKIMIINQCFFSSILLSVFIYAFIFNAVSLIEKYRKEKFEPGTKIGYPLSLAANIIYFLIGLLFLTVYKDIVYPICVVILELGLISNKQNYFSETLLNVFIVFLTFFTVVWTVFIYKYKVFKIKEDN